MFKTKGNKKEKGQGLVEYALILVLVAIVVIGVLKLLGPIIGGVFSTVNNSLSGVGGGSGEAAAVVPTATPELSPGCMAINGYNYTYWGDMWPGSDMQYNAGETITFTLNNPSNLDVAFRSVPYYAEFGRTTNSSYTASYTIPTTQNYRWWVDIYVQANITVDISCN